MLSLQEISDRLEIQDLVVRYADALDRLDFDLLDQVFTPDAFIDYTALGGTAGNYPEMKAGMPRSFKPFGNFQHLVANHEIRLQGDTATGRVMCLNPMGAAGEPATQDLRLNGIWYNDTYKRTSDGWRITTRKEERAFVFYFPVRS